MNELFVLPTYVKERKRNETLATFPLQAIIKVVSSIGSDEVPAHFVLDAAKELVVRASGIIFFWNFLDQLDQEKN